METHDAQIVEHLRTALIQMRHKYLHDLMFYCQGLLRTDDTALAEELAMQTMLDVPKHLEHHPGKGLRSVLFMIATQLCTAHERAIKLGGWITDDALGHLSSHDRVLLFLKDIQGFAHQEIGEILGIKTPTVRVQYGRAKARHQQA